MKSKRIAYVFSKGGSPPLGFKGPSLQILVSSIATFFFFPLSNSIGIWKSPCYNLIQRESSQVATIKMAITPESYGKN